jgi:large repetitive protein
MLRRWLMISIVLAAVAPVDAAAGAWQPDGSGSGHSTAETLAAGNVPTVSVSNRTVTVSWTASSSGAPANGYIVRRYDPSDQQAPIGANCAGVVSGSSCVESDVPGGSWRYAVVPARANWRGAESPKSATAIVASPSLTLSPTTVNALPATLTGQIQGFSQGQTVSFRLDDASAGPVLSGNITPSPVPASGTAAVSVTIPSGTADGAHTVHAIGSSGDVASAPITVDTSCSAPGDQVATASRDSYVDSLSAGSNFGSGPELFTRSAQVLVLSQRRSVVAFNLPSVPARCTLAGATLHLYASNPAGGRTINALRLNGSWTESGVTWNNVPATTGTAASSASLSSAGWQSWNVLSQTQAMYAGADNGFLVKDSADSAVLSVQQIYQSRNGTPDSQDPQLVLTFE